MTLIVATQDDLPITWPKSLKRIIISDVWDTGYLGPIRVGDPLAVVPWNTGVVSAQARSAAGAALAFTPTIDLTQGALGQIRFTLTYLQTRVIAPGTYTIELERDRITWFRFPVTVEPEITTVP